MTKYIIILIQLIYFNIYPQGSLIEVNRCCCETTGCDDPCFVENGSSSPCVTSILGNFFLQVQNETAIDQAILEVYDSDGDVIRTYPGLPNLGNDALSHSFTISGGVIFRDVSFGIE